MAELGGIDIENLIAARSVLKSSLEKSRDAASEMDKAGPRLEEMNRRLPSLDAAIRTVGKKCSLLAIGGHIDRALGPAAAALKVFDTVRELEGLLLRDPSADLFRYLSLAKQLEEALRFLADNCALVIRWLEDAAQFLQDNSVDDDRYVLNVRKSLRILKELQAMEEKSCLSGGALFCALAKLETEFQRLLTEKSFPTFPLPVMQKLQAITDRMHANNRIEKCASIYVEVRSSNARASMKSLDLDYLETSLSEFESVQTIESYVDQWGNHLEFALQHVFELEYGLCNEVFRKVGSDVWMACFAEIAIRSGMPSFIEFGHTVTKGKKDAIKLLKLLDIFAALNRQRFHFNRLFGGNACAEIQTQTRDLIKKVVDGACEIFWELSVQAGLQRQSVPPPDGSVPRLVSFVTDYCNRLLEEDYWAVLIQVAEIHRSWNRGEFEDDDDLSKEVFKIMNAIELNLETWAKTYEDAALSNLFMMNNHWYLSENLKGTKLGDLMGDSWLRAHEEAMEYYFSIYLRESWGKLPPLLKKEEEEEGSLVLFSDGNGSRSIARDLAKKRLKAFSEAFDDIYKKQSKWVVSDGSLRGKTCEILVQIVVPVYRRFMQEDYRRLVVEQGTSPNKYVKYTAEGLERMLGSLFQPNPGKFGGGGGGAAKCTHLIGKIRNVVTSHFSSTPAAA